MAKKKPTKKPPKAAKKAARPKKAPPPPRTPPAPFTQSDPEDEPLTDQERHFVQEFMVDRRAAAAYRRIRPDVQDARTARREGHDIRNRPHVAAEIRAATRAQAARLQVAADDVLHEVRRVAMSDIYDLFDPHTGLLRHPREMPFDVRRAVSSIRLSRERRSVVNAGATSTSVTESIIEIKLWSKTDALGKLMAHLGLNQAVPPLDVMLNLLPPDVANEVRDLMLRKLVKPTPVPALASAPLTAQVPNAPPPPAEGPK